MTTEETIEHIESVYNHAYTCVGENINIMKIYICPNKFDTFDWETYKGLEIVRPKNIPYGTIVIGNFYKDKNNENAS